MMFILTVDNSNVDIPNLTEDHIQFGERSFYNTADLKAISMLCSIIILHHFLLVIDYYFRCGWIAKFYYKSFQ